MFLFYGICDNDKFSCFFVILNVFYIECGCFFGMSYICFVGILSFGVEKYGLKV